MCRLACGVAGLALLVGGCAINTDEERFRDYNDDGVFLFQRGDYRDARDSFQAALALQPSDPALFYNLGECYERMGNAQKAECYYRDCLRKVPKHPACRHALVELLTRTGRQNDAATLVSGWLKEDGDSGDNHAEAGWLLHHNGDLPAARDELHLALKLEPNNRRALIELALVYEAMNRPDRSVALYERSLAADPNQPAIADRVNYLLAKGAGRPHPD